VYEFLFQFIRLLFDILVYAIIARALLSWFVRPGQAGSGMTRVIAILEEVTEPVVAPIRRVMPRIGMLDLSPLVAIILLQVIQSLLLGALRSTM
jgi:YggT family protein